MIYGGHFEGDKKEEKLKELNNKTLEESFWNNHEESDKVLKEISKIKNNITPIKELINEVNDYIELIDLMTIEELQNLENKLEDIANNITNLEKLTLLNGKYDSLDCIVDIHSGAGGTEACDWAYMIFRMYTRYFEKKGFSYKVLDYQEGEEAGIKSTSIEVTGDNAYGLLKCEKGVHRLVRLSPFDSNNRRHTSFASVEVTPIIETDDDIEIDPKELKIDVYRSSGKGGQGVNTTDSAVRITHLPTKTVVTCQNERSQIQNKEEAMRVLKSKLLLMKSIEEEEHLRSVKGEEKNIEFGSQIRSYVMHPYSMVKDHRTNYETSNVLKVLDGDLDNFIDAYLKK